MAFLRNNDRTGSKNWLVGFTVGCYAILSLSLFFFGNGSWLSTYFEPIDYAPPGRLASLVFLAVGLFIGLLDFVQIYSEYVFKYKANRRVTLVSVWLNAMAISSWFALIALNSLDWRAAATVAYCGLVIAFPLGILISIFHILWILIARARSGRIANN
jgi:uncharacterized membrane protein